MRKLGKKDFTLLFLSIALIISIIGNGILIFNYPQISTQRDPYVLSIFVVLGVIFDIAIFIDPFNAFNIIPPTNSGEALIDYNVNTFSVAGILMAIFLISVTIILGLGFLIKSLKTTGELRRKLFLVSMGAFCFCIFGLIEGLTAPDIYVIIVRIGYLASFWLLYFGLKD